MDNIVGKVDIGVSIRDVAQESTSVSASSRIEKRPLTAVFHCATAKVLDFLAMYREFDYAVSDVAKGTGLNLKTASKELEGLSSLGLVKFTRKVGRSDMYRINDTGPAKYLLTFVNERIIENLESIQRSEQVNSAEIPKFS